MPSYPVMVKKLLSATLKLTPLILIFFTMSLGIDQESMMDLILR